MKGLLLAAFVAVSLMFVPCPKAFAGCEGGSCGRGRLLHRQVVVKKEVTKETTVEKSARFGARVVHVLTFGRR